MNKVRKQRCIHAFAGQGFLNLRRTYNGESEQLTKTPKTVNEQIMY